MFHVYISQDLKLSTQRQQPEYFTLRKDDYGPHKCLAWLTFLHCMFWLFSPFLHYVWDKCCWISLFLFIHTSTNDEQTKFVFPGKKSPCSSARIKVASVDQVITGLHIRLIEGHVSALTLQQFYCWNCRAECSTAGRDHLSLTFSLYPLRDGRTLPKPGEAANRGASI